MKWNWHHRLLCQTADRFISGEWPRVIISMPPRHGKSEFISRRMPALILGRNPDAQIIAASYSTDLAGSLCRDSQRIIDDPSYQELFPGTRLADSNQGGYARNTELFEVVGRRGKYKAAGVGSGITGHGFDYGLIDDPLKDRLEAESPRTRQAIWDWYTSTFSTRAQPGAKIMVIMTRWHQDDLAGRLLKLARDEPDADQWHLINLPAIAETGPTEIDPRQPGEALWPTQYPLSRLNRIKNQSLYDWDSLYQGNPRGAGTAEFPSGYFDGIYFDQWPADITIRTLALDPSKGRESKSGDYAAAAALAITAKGDLYIDMQMERINIEDMLDHVMDHAIQFSSETGGQLEGLAVETNQFQELLAGMLYERSIKFGTLPIFKIENRVSKQLRIRRLTPYLASGKLKIRDNPGGRLLVEQLQQFPTGQHDDGPDAVEMAIRLAGSLVGVDIEAAGEVAGHIASE